MRSVALHEPSNINRSVVIAVNRNIGLLLLNSCCYDGSVDENRYSPYSGRYEKESQLILI